MVDNNENGEKVDFSSSKAANSEKKNSPRKIKIVVAVFVLILFLVAATVILSFFLLKRPSSRLAEVQLEDGDTFVYHIDQKLEAQTGDFQQAGASAFVVLRVLNKTSDEYWFFMKILIEIKGKDEKVSDSLIKDYFLVKLHTTTRTKTFDESHEPFEVYGNQKTDGNVVHYVCGVLEQLLPSLERDLYEDIDGNKQYLHKQPPPEKSPLLPGAVRMHREANTSDKNALLVRSHFSSSDLVNRQLGIDVDVKYVGSAAINKSTGMVSESVDHVTERLFFGEAIHSKNGSDMKELNVTFTSQVTLIETDSGYLPQEEVQTVDLHLFGKLRVSYKASAAAVRASEQAHSPPLAAPSDPTHTPPNGSVKGPQNLSRHQRSLIREKRSVSVPFVNTLKLFEKKVLGVNIAAESKAWLEIKTDRPKEPEFGVNFTLKLGDFIDVPVYDFKYPQQANSKPSEIRWSKEVPYEVPVWGIFSVGAEFKLQFKLSIAVNLQEFPTITIEPFAEVDTTITGYGSVQIFRVGIFGKGTLVRASLPVKLSYIKPPSLHPLVYDLEGIHYLRGGYQPREQVPLYSPNAIYPGGGYQPIEHVPLDSPNAIYPAWTWCLSLSANFTAVELSAGISYQRWRCRGSFWRWWRTCSWGVWEPWRQTGKWAAIKKSLKLFHNCY